MNSLTVNAANADVTVAVGAVVTGSTKIEDVKSETFTNNGVLGEVIITDTDGTRFINAPGATTGTIDLATEGDVTLEGTITETVTLSKKANVTVPKDSNITRIIVSDKASGAKVTNEGTVADMEINAPTTVTSATEIKATIKKGIDVIVKDNEADKGNTVTGTDDSVANIKDAANKVAADKVDALITALPEAGSVVIGNKIQIEAARVAYDALSEDQVSLVTEGNLALLIAAEAEIEVLEDAIVDQEAADVVDALITALPEAGSVVIGNKAQIEAARSAFSALTEEQQALVSDVDALTAAEAELEVLEEAIKVAKLALKESLTKGKEHDVGTAGDFQHTNGTLELTLSDLEVTMKNEGNADAKNIARIAKDMAIENVEVTNTEVELIANSKANVEEVFKDYKVNTMARYLGALNNATGSTVNKIKFEGKTYVWNSELKTYSKWVQEDSDTTLMSQFKANLSDKMTIEIIDENGISETVTVKFTGELSGMTDEINTRIEAFIKDHLKQD